MQLWQLNKESLNRSEKETENGTALLLSDLIKTREVRTIIANAVPEVLNAWAGANQAKKATTRFIGNTLKKGLLKTQDGLSHQELIALFQNPEHIKHLIHELPKFLDMAADLATSFGKGIAQMPADEKKDVLENIVTGMASGRTGKLITQWANVMASMEQDAPGTVAKLLQPGVTHWIENTDFGALKDLLKTASDISGDLVKHINDAVWQYPAKVVLLVSFIPDLLNMTGKVLNESLGRFNDLPPDLVADVVLSCLRDIDTRRFAGIVNILSEMVVQLDTGSSLIGDGGVSAFSREIDTFVRRFSNTIDMKKAFRARQGLSSGKESLNNALVKVMQDNPDLLLNAIENAQYRYNPAIKALYDKAAVLADLPEEDTAQAITGLFSGLEISDIAETVNLAAEIYNNTRQNNKTVLSSVLSEFVDNLDIDEVEEAAGSLIQDIREEFRPIGKVVLPQLMDLATDWLSGNGNKATPNTPVKTADKNAYSVSQPVQRQEVQL